MDGNVVTKHLNQSTYLLYEFYFILCRYWILKISLRSNIKGSKQAKVGHYKFYRNNMGCMLNSADRVIFDRRKSCLEIQCMWFELTHLSKEQRIGEKCNYCTYQEDIEKPQKGEHCLPRAEFLRTSFVFEMDVSVSWMSVDCQSSKADCEPTNIYYGEVHKHFRRLPEVRNSFSLRAREFSSEPFKSSRDSETTLQKQLVMVTQM